ncbi:glutamate synthase subunit beta [Kaustia mangrovi]|uniref:Glutamate synthase subunit beta n=1 Tax=Kaustia mangrovi TaxID=2593653 RepID=A0A7S8C2K3_9HYPH|nr:glutamate synthase subunit beta [Kaustia mangrovi]QPC42198.1 glutamate synthase subunit beta [Kaustia mangrovi]
MGKITGFLEIDRQEQAYAPAGDRIRHFREFVIPMEDRDVERQAQRCMDCGIPYCHTGCPVNNQIPDWNDLVYQKDWTRAARNLHSTNNFPEITGRICPAPCEEACTLNLEDAPVTIKSIECAIADKALSEGWVAPVKPEYRTGKNVAVVGSGPAGLAAAQQLARAGHDVHVFERQAHAGGLLRYGIPDFKMEKHHIDLRVRQMEEEGVTFHFNANIGVERPMRELIDGFDAVLLTCGAERPRDPGLPGLELDGVEYAMPYLIQQNKRVGGESLDRDGAPILAGGKHVVVIGGGDTASDCIGTAFRQAALSVTQLDIRPMPPLREDKLSIWPYWPTKFRTSSSQAEGAEREFSCVTLGLEGENGHVTAVRCARCDESRKPIAGTEFTLRADLVLLAIGFAGPLEEGLLEEFPLERDGRTNVKADTQDYLTSHPKVFAAGDMRKGQSLVVWAIREGRQAAHSIDKFLMGHTELPR